jgi:hypothetical protein
MSESISYLRLTIDGITILVLHTLPHTLISRPITLFLERTGESVVDRTCSKQVLVAFCVVTRAMKRVVSHRIGKKPWEVTFILKNITF